METRKITILFLSKFTDFASILRVSGLTLRTPTLVEEKILLKDMHLHIYLYIEPNTYFINILCAKAFYLDLYGILYINQPQYFLTPNRNVQDMTEDFQ